MRTAVLSDVHGNLPALRSVLAEVGQDGFDLVISGGDVAAGPMPAQCLDLLAALPAIRWVRGNADRCVVDAFDGVLEGDDGDPAFRADSFAAAAITREHRDLLASFEPVVAVDRILFCHGSPRSDTEIITPLTPPSRLGQVLGGADADLVVGGHTHMQADRTDGPVRYVNAGSVGMPYEGVAAHAFWLELDGAEPRLRRSAYDPEIAAAEIRATGYPDADELIAGCVLGGEQPAAVAAFFERAAAG